MTGTNNERTSELRLEAIGGNLVEVSAIGAFRSADVDALSRRLTRLASAGPARVRIDCSRVTSLDPEIVGLFSTAAAALTRGGGVLQLIAVPDGLGIIDGDVSEPEPQSTPIRTSRAIR